MIYYHHTTNPGVLIIKLPSRIFNKIIRSIKKQFIKISPQYWLTVGLVFLIFFTVSYNSLDPDFGWHLMTGKYYLQNWIPQYDIFTLTAHNFSWVSHEWLNDYLVASVYSVGGYSAVAGLFALIWTSSLVVASRKHHIIALLLTTFALLPFAGIRPIVWTVFFIAILERILNSKNKKASYYLPILFIFWVNLHGSFILGLVFVALWQLLSKKKLPWLPVVLCIPSILINPYGLHVFEEILRTGLDAKLRYRISEWRMIILPILSTTYLVIFTALHWVFAKKPLIKARSFPGMMLMMTLSSIRHFPVFAIVSMRYLEDHLENFGDKIKINKLSKFKVFVVSLVIFIPLLTITYNGLRHIRKTQDYKEYYPAKAVDYLRASRCPGNIFNSYSFGGYLIWQLPQHKVYIDGRMPSWKLGSIDYFENYKNVFSRDEFRREEFAKYNIKCVITNTADSNFSSERAVPFGEQLVSEGWVKIGEGSANNYSLFIQQ